MSTAPSNQVDFSTDGFAERDRFDIFRDEIISRNGSLDVARLGAGTFRAELHRQTVGPIVVGSIVASPLDLIRTRSMLADGNDSFVIHMCRSGQPVSTQLDEALRLTPGDAVICDWRNTGSFRLESETRFSSINIPRPVLSTRLRHLPKGGALLTGNDTARRLLFSYIDAASAVQLPDGSRATELYGEHILDLVALAIGARGDYAEVAHQRGVKAARLSAIRSDVMAELGRHDLSAEVIAARHGISPRYVGKLFEQDGTSFKAYVLAARLAKAHGMLIDRRYGYLSITQIAHESGFGDISYFNRTFRRVHGATPSDIREATRLGREG